MNADSFISTLLLRLQSSNESWIARIGLDIIWIQLLLNFLDPPEERDDLIICKMATQNYFNKFLHPDIDLRGSLGSYMDIIWWLAFANHLRPSRRAGRSDFYTVEWKILSTCPRNYSWRKVFFDTIPNIREYLRPTRRPSNKTLFLLIYPADSMNLSAERKHGAIAHANLRTQDPAPFKINFITKVLLVLFLKPIVAYAVQAPFLFQKTILLCKWIYLWMIFNAI